ncbi:hypothetical protein [Kribbella sindirgiensis]|uniref:Uncharacterized protein n=1 Tax=Kribbella sindirgiensis TaxID=1124744 RepID=A0A4R0I237_9ACTN|nr:hypothetical protein [Kribbella sindirgiensis]TCC19936.1 hypothetical protein E0H50_37535 [Kribbella sindirgiensis]
MADIHPNPSPSYDQAERAAEMYDTDETLTTCRHCKEQLEDMGPGIGWVEKRSGDDGGTYDVCTETWDAKYERHGRHEPEEG